MGITLKCGGSKPLPDVNYISRFSKLSVKSSSPIGSVRWRCTVDLPNEYLSSVPVEVCHQHYCHLVQLWYWLMPDLRAFASCMFVLFFLIIFNHLILSDAWCGVSETWRTKGQVLKYGIGPGAVNVLIAFARRILALCSGFSKSFWLRSPLSTHCGLENVHTKGICIMMAACHQWKFCDKRSSKWGYWCWYPLCCQWCNRCCMISSS